MIKFSKHKHSKSQWITKGIIRSIAYKDKLYIKLKQTPIDSEQYINHKTNFAIYKRILKKLICNAKKHYQNRFEKCKNDIKQTWCAIKEVINQTSKKLEFSDHFLIDNKLINDTSVIANKFNCFFTNVGPKLAAVITKTNNANFMNYLQNPILHNFTFKRISEGTTINILDNLKPKPSCGNDGISTKLLKTNKTRNLQTSHHHN